MTLFWPFCLFDSGHMAYMGGTGKPDLGLFCFVLLWRLCKGFRKVLICLNSNQILLLSPLMQVQKADLGQ